MTATVSDSLLHWYDTHARALPWRNPPGDPRPADPAWPYRVWLSEVMLQQTTVAAVKPYFEAFTRRWPSVFDLALAEEADVMAAWAGLGYYSRARNLHACARMVAERGGFPDTEAELRKLPGLGAYTAAAIAAIAFGERAVVVDANVERVVARLFAIDAPLPGARGAIRAAADTITPADRAGDFAQAMMDLGAQVCAARAPRCLLCPLAQVCEGRRAGDPERLPVKPPKKAKPQRSGTAFWIGGDDGHIGDCVWLTRREGQGMLGGMRALPDDGWSAQRDGHGEPPLPGEWRDVGSVRPGFTHFDLTMTVMAYVEGPLGPLPEGEYWPVDDLSEAGLPTLFAKAARLVMAQQKAGVRG